jgi:tRNA-dihydrouridine synthase B
MVAQTGCDAVMIGRTAPSNPWIFRQIAQYNARVQDRRTAEDRVFIAGSVAASEASVRRDGQSYDEPSDYDRYQMIRTYFQMLIEEEMPDAVGKMKQFASWFTHGVPGGAGLRKSIYETKDEHIILMRVEEFFERSPQANPA